MFGTHVNTQRATAQLMDGCKPVTRRIIYCSYLLGDKLTKSATVMGKTIGEQHPHGMDSLYTTIVGLVRAGIMHGQGQWGGKSMLIEGDTEPAAPRYTECKLKDSFYEFFDSLMGYVPMVDSEIDGYKTPLYLPTPLPLSLITGTFGIGFGMNVVMPAFTPKSLLDAYLHNDPSRLRVPYDLLVDYKLSELDKLWTEGQGNIIYSLKVEKGYSLDGESYGTIITGDPSLFKPTLPEDLIEMIESGRVRMRDESGPSGPRLFIGREKRVTVVTDEWIHERCKMACIKSINYRINIADGDKAGRIGIRDWIDVTYKNYVQITKTRIHDEIEKIKWKLTLIQYADQVMDAFQKSGLTASNSDLAKSLKIDEEIVADIMKSSLASWRRMDKDKRVAKLTTDLNYWETQVPETTILNLINNL